MHAKRLPPTPTIFEELRDRYLAMGRVRISRMLRCFVRSFSTREELQLDPQGAQCGSTYVGDTGRLRIRVAPSELRVPANAVGRSDLPDDPCCEVSKHQVRRLERDDYSWPGMQGCWNGLAGWDRDIEHEDECILKGWVRDEARGPAGGRCGRRRRDWRRSGLREAGPYIRRPPPRFDSIRESWRARS